MVIALILVNALALVLLFYGKASFKGGIACFLVIINSSVTSWISFSALDESFAWMIDGGSVLGHIPIRCDALSGWFILLMNFTAITGILYGKRYMIVYADQTEKLTLHYICYIINHWAMFGIFVVQSSLAFLCIWELMAISAFILIIFDHAKIEVLKAGINYLIQSHVCIIFLMVGFIWVTSKTGSYDFNSITTYVSSTDQSINFLLFLCFFIGFSIKAGFVPFHTWLPYAHPAAPAHVSGVMSAVMIKLGIYGILRMLLLMNDNYLLIGYMILFISIISGVYGVLLAIIQHNLKKLLAYHSIENIGIIGIGVGIGCIGLGTNSSVLVFAGFGGALLHTLNHSLFKSLLFYCSGAIYQSKHTLNIEKLGGLFKQTPHTGGLFLLAALSICGLPPFNGFISEFFLYSGLFSGISDHDPTQASIFIGSVFGLVIIGGLAILCFTKAFSVVFLGDPRHYFPQKASKENFVSLFPMYLISVFIVTIGLFPHFFANMVMKPVSIFGKIGNIGVLQPNIMLTLQRIGFAAFAIVLLSLFILWIKRIVTSQRKNYLLKTWSCGYVTQGPSFQYTANSFVRTFRKLVHPMLMMNKKEGMIDAIFPEQISSATNPYDRIEAAFIDFPLRKMKAFMGSFHFLQNGKVQIYILYGICFIFLVLIFPLLLISIVYIKDLLNQI